MARLRQDYFDESIDRLRARQVRGKHLGIDVIFGRTIGGDAVQGRFVSSREQDIEPAGGKFKRKSSADAGRCAGDDGPILFRQSSAVQVLIACAENVGRIQALL